jgi:hypothetical protein
MLCLRVRCVLFSLSCVRRIHSTNTLWVIYSLCVMCYLIKHMSTSWHMAHVTRYCFDIHLMSITRCVVHLSLVEYIRSVLWRYLTRCLVYIVDAALLGSLNSCVCNRIDSAYGWATIKPRNAQGYQNSCRHLVYILPFSMTKTNT